ncbi:hypothetical protein, partial [Burkholderia singularis]|uniref:hypothetical protein n=1 Tax=Burkholderia singularis TaxID=1503053 RepID=UPI001C44F9DF
MAADVDHAEAGDAQTRVDAENSHEETGKLSAIDTTRMMRRPEACALAAPASGAVRSSGARAPISARADKKTGGVAAGAPACVARAGG